jgi:hypothetical protein
MVPRIALPKRSEDARGMRCVFTENRPPCFISFIELLSDQHGFQCLEKNPRSRRGMVVVDG